MTRGVFDFASVGVCIKCGGNASNCVSRTYHGRLDCFGNNTQYDVKGEVMRVECRSCGYSWFERPRDWIDPTPPAPPAPTLEEVALAEVEEMLSNREPEST